jgi:integrase
MDGYVKNANYKGVKAEWEEADTVYTNWEEIEAIKNTKLEAGSMEDKVRDIYVFNCYCGLRFSDLCKVNKFSFFRENGQLMIKLRQQKTDNIIKFPILPSAEKVLIKYNYSLPVVSDGGFHTHLKTVCFKAGLTQMETIRETKGGKPQIKMLPKYTLISSHTGRRSFATNFDDDGVPLKEIMAVTGHSTEKSLRIYIKKKSETKFTGFLNIGSLR